VDVNLLEDEERLADRRQKEVYKGEMLRLMIQTARDFALSPPRFVFDGPRMCTRSY